MNFRQLFIVVCVVLLSGCVATGPIYQNAPDPKESDALIYIYRPSSFAGGARDAYFYVNDVNIADISSEGYTWFHVPAGEYVLKQKWPVDVAFGKTIEAKVKWLPKQKYYYRLSTGASVGAGTVNFRWQITEINSGQAEAEISVCKLQPSFNINKVNEQTKR